MPLEIHSHTNNVQTIRKVESKKDTTWSIIRKNLVWMNECLLELEKFTTHFSQYDLHNQRLEIVSHTVSKRFFFSFNHLLQLIQFRTFCTCTSHKRENTRWLFIDKTVITAYNWLNIQCNRLFQRSNRLYYHFNWLKCSLQKLENFQEQCNRLKQSLLKN